MDFVAGRYGELWENVEATEDDFDEYALVDAPILRTYHNRIPQPDNGLVLTKEGQVYNIDNHNTGSKNGYTAIAISYYQDHRLVWLLRNNILQSHPYEDGIIKPGQGNSLPCLALLYTLDDKILVHFDGQWIVVVHMIEGLNRLRLTINLPNIDEVTEIGDRYLLTDGYIHTLTVKGGANVISTKLEDDCFLVGIGEYQDIKDKKFKHYIIMICGEDYRRVVIDSLRDDRITVRNHLLNTHINNHSPISFIRSTYRGPSYGSDCLVCDDGTVIFIDKDGGVDTLPIPPEIFKSRGRKSARNKT